MLSSILSQLGTDQLEWLKFWLLIPTDVVSAIGVVLGVYLESKIFSEATNKRGEKILLVSLAAEVLFGILIFSADARVSSIQRREITALEERLASRAITNEETKVMAAALERYTGQLYEVNTYKDDGEAVSFAAAIDSVLLEAHWATSRPTRDIAIVGVIAGVVAYVSDDAPKATKDAAWALVFGLRAKHIDAMVRAIQGTPPNLINVTVGIKP